MVDGLGDAMTRNPGETLVGATLDGRWRIGVVIGSGALARVHQAQGPNGTDVAVYVLHAHLAGDEELAREYLSAARRPTAHRDLVSSLAHGHTADGAPYVVGELLVGETVARLLARRRRGVPPAEALRIVSDALDALEAAHESGVVHGDLSPARLFVCDDGTVKLMGLGLAKARQRAGRRSSGTNALEPSYLAPELLRGGAASISGDLWAMTAILVALLTGPSTSLGETAGERGASRAPASLHGLSSSAPDALVRLVESGLALDPSARFTSARELRAAVRRAALVPGIDRLRSLCERTPTKRGSAPTAAPSASTPPSASAPHPGAPSQADDLGSAPTQKLRGLAPTLPAVPAQRAPSRRPSADDVDALVSGLRAAFRALEEAVRARANGEQDAAPEARATIALLLEAFQALPSASTEPIGWSVTQRSFVLAGRNVWEPSDALAWVPAELFTAGVRRVEFKRGVDAAELGRLIDALQPGATKADRAGGDLATLIRVEAFPHFVAHLADAFSSRIPSRPGS